MKLQLRRGTPDPNDLNLRVFFSHEELTSKTCCGTRGFLLEEDNPVLEVLLQIRGVVHCSLSPYSVAIVKAPTWEWEDIEPSLLRLLSTFNLGEGSLEGETPPCS